MSGATLRVEYKLADSCRANSCVSKLILDSKASFIDARQLFALSRLLKKSMPGAIPPTQLVDRS
jgi:hypothetical protein